MLNTFGSMATGVRARRQVKKCIEKRIGYLAAEPPVRMAVNLDGECQHLLRENYVIKMPLRVNPRSRAS